MGIDRRYSMNHLEESGSTEGREVYRRWRLGGFEYRSDLIGGDYMRRWTVTTPWFSLRLHHILRSDLDRHHHDHPFSFVSLILRGGYVERSPGGPPRVCRPGTVVVRRAEDLHSLTLLGESAWTLVAATPRRKRWGFDTEDGWVFAGEYDAWKRAALTRRESSR
jgi:hypothetical protein